MVRSGHKMNYNREEYLTDPIPLMLAEAHLVGGMVKSNNSSPCSICRSYQENGDKSIVRDHFHGSDFGACARKVYGLMKQGYKSSSSDPVFLNDGHLHEHSMLSNLIAGLPDGWSVKAMENQSERQLNVLGILLIGHV